jgi:DNA polymerase-3 subunit alpha
MDGYGTSDQIAERVVELGHSACAITDHGNCFAHVPHVKAFKQRGLKAILGVEFYVTDNLKNREGTPSQERGANSYPHVTVLAMNQAGYTNLLQLHRISYEEGLYYKPRIDWDELARHQEGLVVLSGCIGGYPCGYIRQGKIEEAHNFMWQQSQRIQHFYVELIPEPHISESTLCNAWLLSMASSLSLPVVMTSDAHFPRREDHEAQDLMLSVGLGKPLSNAERWLRLPEYQYYCSRGELLDRAIRTNPEIDPVWWNLALDNTVVIANKCNVEIPRAEKVLFPGLPANTTSEQHLWNVIVSGLKQKTQEQKTCIEERGGYDNYLKRVTREYQTIVAKGFCDYMLAIIDVVNWIKSKDSLVMCRGSAGGCLILWVTGASETDPILHELSFERFYDENRPDPPDVDIDFEAGIRDSAIEYVFQKYGHANCSQIANLSRLKPKSALQDACFAYGIPRSEYSDASAFLESFEDEEVGEARFTNQHPAVKSLFTKYPQLMIVFKLIGQYRQSGIHAAGVIISSEPLDGIIGVMTGAKKQSDGTGVPISTVDKYGAVDLGFLKMDFLSVKTLDILSMTLRRIGQKPRFLYDLPLDDKASLTTAKKGLLAGVFQLDGGSAWRVSNQIGLDTFYDLVAASALCRPGPGDWVDTYRAFKSGEFDFDLYRSQINSIAANILTPTYGILLYQDQLMRFAREIALFEWPDVHALRKGAAASEGTEFMDKFHLKFVNGCMSNNVSETEAEFWWNSIKTHGGYSFGKAHCVTYGIVSYWTLYLKTHYPAAFYESYLTLEGAQSTPNEMLMKRLISEFSNIGGKLVALDPVHVGMSFRMIDDTTMTGGLMNIKGIGKVTAEKVLAKGPFANWDELLAVCPAGIANKLRCLQSAEPDPQDTLPIAPWLPIVATHQDLAKLRDSYGAMTTESFTPGRHFEKNPYVTGYVTFTHFKHDKIVFMIEDEYGSITARLAAKKVAAEGDTYRQLRVGDYVVITGWWNDTVMYVNGFNIVYRKPEVIKEKKAKEKRIAKSTSDDRYYPD